MSPAGNRELQYRVEALLHRSPEQKCSGLFVCAPGMVSSATSTVINAQWNAGGKHMNQVFRKEWFEKMGLLSLLE